MNNNTSQQFLVSRKLTAKSVYTLQGLVRTERAKLKSQRKGFKVADFAAKLAQRFTLPLNAVQRICATV